MNVAGDAHHFDDLADEEVGEVDAVAEQVGRDAVATLVDEVAPAQRTQRVVAIARQEATAVVRDRADAAGVDERLGVLHERRPAVVVADTGGDVAGCPLGRGDLRRGAADRLLAEHRLARRGRRARDLDMEHVGRGDHHDVDARVLDDSAPVVGCGREAEVGDGRVTPASRGVGTQHELGLGDAVGEQRRDPPVAAAVRLTHPPQPDHADPDVRTGSHE